MLNDILEIYPFRFIDMVEKFGNVWFSTCNFNGLFKADLTQGTVGYVRKFPQDKPGAMYLHSTVVTYGDKLVFCPMYSNNFVIYDISENKFDYYKVSDLETAQAFYGAGQYQKFLYIWNVRWSISNTIEVFRFDMETKEVVKVKMADNASVSEDVESDEKLKLGRIYCVVDEKIYILSLGKGAVLQVDMKKNEKKIHMLHGEKGLRTICYVGDNFFLTDVANQIIEWYPEREIVKHKIDDNVPIGQACMGIFFDNKIYYTLARSQEILIYHLENKEFEFMEMYNGRNKYSGYEDIMAGSLMLKARGNKIWLLSNEYSLLQYIIGEEVCNKELKLLDNVEQFIYDRVIPYFLKAEIRYEKEDKVLGLMEYLTFIYLKQDDDIKGEREQISYGEQIYKELGIRI